MKKKVEIKELKPEELKHVAGGCSEGGPPPGKKKHF